MSDYEDERQDDDEENDESFQIKSKAILLTWNINIEEETTFDDFKDWILLNADDDDEISLCQEMGSHNHFHAYIS